jgi:hypothetical protein
MPGNETFFFVLRDFTAFFLDDFLDDFLAFFAITTPARCALRASIKEA